MFTKEREYALIMQIALRAADIARQYGFDLGGAAKISGYLTVVHYCVLPLRLQDMLDTPNDLDLLYDINGIDVNLRSSKYGTYLKDEWQPRFAVKYESPAPTLFDLVRVFTGAVCC